MTEELDLEALTTSSESTLIRIVEWSEWLPITIDERSGKSIKFHNGYTAIATGKTEKLLRVEGTGTHQHKILDVTDQETGETKQREFGLYAFQATLAQNITDELAQSLLDLQRPPVDDDLSRNRKNDLVVVQNGMGKIVPPPPPRKKSRKK